MKKDIRKYTDQELSLVVFNSESLHRIRHELILFELLDENFIYTPEQLKHLKEDLTDDLKQRGNDD